MVTIDSTATQPSASGMPGRLIGAVGIWANRLAAYLERRDAIKALRELDDRRLRDIGLARDQIEAAVYGGVNTARPSFPGCCAARRGCGAVRC